MNSSDGHESPWKWLSSFAAGGHLMGSMRLTILDRSNQTADFGYTLNRRHWKNGYATEGARALLNVAFVSLGLHRVWATCDARNRASYRVLEKLGMRREAAFQKGCAPERRVARLLSLCHLGGGVELPLDTTNLRRIPGGGGSAVIERSDWALIRARMIARPAIDMIPLKPERQAQLEEYAQRRGQDPATALDEALAEYLDWERQDYAEAVEGILRGYEDVKAGRTRAATELLADLGQKHGISS